MEGGEARKGRGEGKSRLIIPPYSILFGIIIIISSISLPTSRPLPPYLFVPRLSGIYSI